MRNRSEFVWLAIVLIVAAVGIRFVRFSSPSPPVNVTSTMPPPEMQAVEYPRSHAALSRTSFHIERITNSADGKRRLYEFNVNGTQGGADYVATLAADGHTSRASGHLSEAEYRTLFDSLEQHGAWKLVDVGGAAGSGDHTSIFIQAGDWSNRRVLGPKYADDRLAASFMTCVNDSLIGSQEKTLEASLAHN